MTLPFNDIRRAWFRGNSHGAGLLIVDTRIGRVYISELAPRFDALRGALCVVGQSHEPAMSDETYNLVVVAATLVLSLIVAAAFFKGWLDPFMKWMGLP